MRGSAELQLTPLVMLLEEPLEYFAVTESWVVAPMLTAGWPGEIESEVTVCA
jgi:hypothetical protein